MISVVRTFALLGIALPGVTAKTDQHSPTGYSSWQSYAGSADSAQYSDLDQINLSNVQDLEIAWSYSTADNNRYFFAPLVVREVAYVLAQDFSIVALDAMSGKELWKHRPENADQAMTTRGINYWESDDRTEGRLFFASGHKLRAIDARTGRRVSSYGKDGSVDLKEGLGRDPNKLSLVQSHAPGRVYEDLLIVGSATNEGYGSAPGDVRAYDVRSGDLVWTFHTIPHPGEFGYETWPADAWKTVGGANVWTEFTVDEVRGIVYLPVASAKYNFYGADRAGRNLYSNCLVALDARTGKRLWYFQFVHHDIWDYDPATAPKLLTVDHGGERIDVVAQATKQGFLYVFNRLTGEPLWPVEERPVPQYTEMAHETLWPTQPFPTKPEPFSRQSFTEKDINPYLSDVDHARTSEMLRGARNEGLFTPPGQRDTIQMPGNNGGSNWGGGAVDPERGWLYVVSKDFPAVLKLEAEVSPSEPPPDDPELRSQYLYDVHCHRCHTVSVQENPLAVSSLVGVTDKLSDAQILTVIKQGQGPMPGFPKLSDNDVSLLLGFLKDPTPITRQRATISEQLEGRARFVSGFGLATAGNGLPLIGPPWTTLTAYDLNEGVIAWQIPLGSVPALAEQGIEDTGSVFQKVGPVVTAGGLLFAGAKDGKVRAFDARSGQLVWQKDLGIAMEGIPAIYQVEGKQYLLFCASAQKGLTSATQVEIRGKYIALALPD